MNRPFSPDQFTPSERNTAKDKCRFANHFVRFVEEDFKMSHFYEWFYFRLSRCFGHIEHYDKCGFCNTFFKDTASKITFILHTQQHIPVGDPAFTYCDVERAIIDWMQSTNVLTRTQAKLLEETEAEERAELARLKDKYE